MNKINSLGKEIINHSNFAPDYLPYTINNLDIMVQKLNIMQTPALVITYKGNAIYQAEKISDLDDKTGEIYYKEKYQLADELSDDSLSLVLKTLTDILAKLDANVSHGVHELNAFTSIAA